MRWKTAFAIALLSISEFSNAQKIETNFKKINLKYLSADAFRMINYELAIRKEKDIQIIHAQKKLYLDKFVADTNLVNQYIKTYQESYESAKNKIIEGDIINVLTPNDVVRFGLEEVKAIRSQTDSRSVDSFLITAARLSFSNYAKGTLTELLNKSSSADTYTQLAKQCIGFASTTKIIDGTKESLAAADVKSIFQATIPVESIENAFDNGIYVGEATALKIQSAIMDLYPSIRSQLSSISKNVQAKQEIIMEFEDVCGKVAKELRHEFKDLSNGLDTLVKNELRVIDIITGLQKDIEEGTMQLEQLNKIAEKGDEKYKKLVSEVMVKSEIVSMYMSGALNLPLVIQNLQNGPLGYLIDKDKRNSLLGNLEELKVPTLTGALNGIGDLSGLLKGIPGASQVAKYVGYAKQALNVGKTIGGLVTAFTPMGFISALSGIGNLIGGLFGGGGPSKEDQKIDELRKEMMQEFQKVHEQLARMDKKLDLIISKIDALIAFAETINKNLVSGFEIQGKKLDYLTFLEESNFNLLKSMALKDYSQCLALKEEFIKKGRKLNSFANLDQFYEPRGNDLSECFQALFGAFSNRHNAWFFYEQNSDRSQKLKDVYAEWKNIVSPSFDILKDQYSSDVDDSLILKAINTLTFPVKETHGSQYLFVETSKQLKVDSSATLDPELILGNGLNAKLIIEFIEHYLYFLPYLEFSKQPGYSPNSFLEYIRLAANQPQKIEDRNDEIINDLKYFLRLTNSSIAQQSLYSGHLQLQRIHSILFKTGARNEENLNHAIKLLESNRLLATNFATFLINNNFYGEHADSLRAIFLESYYKCRDDGKGCESLRMLITSDYPYLSMSYNQKTKTVELIIDKSASGVRDIHLPVPDPLVVVYNKMLYTQRLYQLIDLKKKIIDKLVDYTFTDYLPDAGKATEINSDDFKYLYPLNK